MVAATIVDAANRCLIRLPKIRGTVASQATTDFPVGWRTRPALGRWDDISSTLSLSRILGVLRSAMATGVQGSFDEAFEPLCV